MPSNFDAVGDQAREALRRFEYQSPSPNQIAKMQQLRECFKLVATEILNNTPPCADRTVALRKLHEANMVANVAIMFNCE